MLIGYVRVSKSDGSQLLDLQKDALLKAGVDPKYIYQDLASSRKDDRPGLSACIKALQPGNTPEASLRLAQALITPLQIHKYLTTAMDIAYTTGTKPITEEVINKALARDLNSLEAQLAKIGYQLPAICEFLHASPKEVKDFLYGKSNSPRKTEFLSAIRSIGVTV